MAAAVEGSTDMTAAADGEMVGGSGSDGGDEEATAPRQRRSRRQWGSKQRRGGQVAQLGQGYRERHDGDFDGGVL